MNTDFYTYAIASLIFGDRNDHEDFVQQIITENFKPLEENAISRMKTVSDRLKEVLKSPELPKVVENSSLAIYNIATKKTVEEFLLDNSINEVQRYFGCQLMLKSWTEYNGLTFDLIRQFASEAGPAMEPIVFYKSLKHEVDFFPQLCVYLKNQITKEDIFNLVFGDANLHNNYCHGNLLDLLQPFGHGRLDRLSEIAIKLFQNGAFVDIDLTDKVFKTAVESSVTIESLILAGQKTALVDSEKAKLLFACCYIVVGSWRNKNGDKFQFLLDNLKEENEVVTAEEQKKFFWDLASLVTTFK